MKSFKANLSLDLSTFPQSHNWVLFQLLLFICLFYSCIFDITRKEIFSNWFSFTALAFHWLAPMNKWLIANWPNRVHALLLLCYNMLRVVGNLVQNAKHGRWPCTDDIALLGQWCSQTYLQLCDKSSQAQILFLKGTKYLF